MNQPINPKIRKKLVVMYGMFIENEQLLLATSEW